MPSDHTNPPNRLTVDDFLEAASSGDADQDNELFHWLFAKAKSAVSRGMLGLIHSPDVEDVAARAIEKFYKHFDFPGLAALAADHRRNRVFHFLNLVVAQSIVDYRRQRGVEEAREQEPLHAVLDISEVQLSEAKATIRQMSKSDKELLDLRLVRDLSYEEIQNYYTSARRKPPSISALRTRKSRIIDQLRKKLSP